MCVGGLIWLAVTLGRSRTGGGIAAQARIDALLGGKTLEELIAQRKEASRHRRDAEEALESPEMRRAAKVTPLEYEELKQNVDRLEEELSEKKQERIRCETRCEVASYTLEDIHCLEENKAAAGLAVVDLAVRRATRLAATWPAQQYVTNRPIISPTLAAPACTSWEHMGSEDPTPSKSHIR